METPSFIDQIYDISPPVMLWIVINVLMMIAKKKTSFPDWLIPFGALCFGAIVYPLIADPGKVGFASRSPLMAQILTGMGSGGLAVLSHQQFVQIIKRFGLSSGDTQIFKKDEFAKKEVIAVPTPIDSNAPKQEVVAVVVAPVVDNKPKV